MGSVKHILVDGDGLVYRCGFAVEKTKYLVDGLTGEAPEYVYCDSYKEAVEEGKKFDIGYNIWTRKQVEPEENAIKLLDTVFNKIKRKYPEHETVETYVSPSVGNFRDQISKTAKYKGNRDANGKPKHYASLIHYLVQRMGAKTAVGGEADDYLAADLSRLGDSAVCVSLDKDLKQVPGLHYNWVEDKEEQIGKKQATLHLYAQALSGDPTDNIPGLPGIGPVTARKMLSNATSSADCWKIVRAAYKYHFGEPGEAICREMMDLVYLRKDGVNTPWVEPK